MLALCCLALALAAPIPHGHTSLSSVGSDREAVPLGLGLTPVGDALVVTETARQADGELLGMRIDTMSGADVDTLLARQDRIAGSDNEMHRRSRLARRLSSGRGRDEVLEGEATPTVELVALDGTRATYVLDPAKEADTEPLTMGSRWDLPAAGPHDIGWGFVNDDVAYLRIDSMMRYREAFEIWRHAGFESNLGDYLDKVAGSAAKKLAKKRDGRIQQVPSAAETFQELFRAMEREGAGTLVVDLRGNQGGNSAISLILGLFLAEEPELVEVLSDDGYQLRRYSELFHVAHRNAERPPGVPRVATTSACCTRPPAPRSSSSGCGATSGSCPR